MTAPQLQASTNWCVVVADDYGAESVGRQRAELERAPVHYRHLGGPGTLLQRALHRASCVAPASQVVLTVDEECRALWEASFWLFRPAKRFVGANRHGTRLTTAAATLYVAHRDASAVLTILPARAYVNHEPTLRRALAQALEELPGVPEGVLTLGMLDVESPCAEDYLSVQRAAGGKASLVSGIARRPMPLAAQQLRRRGALVASGILIGYAGALAAPLLRHWGGLTGKLCELAGHEAEELRVPIEIHQELPWGVFATHPWHPAAVPQRVIPVCRSGWSGLKSPQSIERMIAYVSAVTAHEPREATRPAGRSATPSSSARSRAAP